MKFNYMNVGSTPDAKTAHLKLEYDPEADAAYVYLRDTKRTSGKHLDDARYIDYDAQDRPVGVEFLGVSRGVNLADVPESDGIKQLLREQHINVLA
jgi:uncharacterized protein YuzE